LSHLINTRCREAADVKLARSSLMKSNLSDRIRNSLRAAGRPFIAAARRAVTPKPPVVELKYQTIQAGVAAGCDMLLPVPSALASAIVDGAYETASVAAVTKLVCSDSVCYDIGGHYGFYTLAMSKLAASGQVHTFEPVPVLADRIQQSVDRSRLHNVKIHALAVAGEVGEMSLRYSASADGDDSMGFLENYGGVNTPRSEAEYAKFARRRTRCVTLDSLEIASPHFIKIDAEGSEAFIVSGGKQLLANSKPRLLIEMHGVDLALQCAQLLASVDYVAIAFSSRALMMPIVWIHRSDRGAYLSLKDHFGDQLSILFGELDGD
jgi:FkbM family methyltransferase